MNYISRKLIEPHQVKLIETHQACYNIYMHMLICWMLVFLDLSVLRILFSVAAAMTPMFRNWRRPIPIPKLQEVANRVILWQVADDGACVIARAVHITNECVLNDGPVPRNVFLQWPTVHNVQV